MDRSGTVPGPHPDRLPDRSRELPVRTCKHLACSQPFRAKRVDQVFCHPRCKDAHFRKLGVRGAQLVPLAMAWRSGRHRGGANKGKLSEMARLVDRWLAEDRHKE